MLCKMEKKCKHKEREEHWCDKCEKIARTVTAKKVVIGRVGVDSGQVMICDPCYIKSDWQDNDDLDDFELSKGKFSYAGCCQATLSKKCGGQLNYKLGHAGAGVAVSTFDGDGRYPVTAHYSADGRIQRIVVEFT